MLHQIPDTLLESRVEVKVSGKCHNPSPKSKVRSPSPKGLALRVILICSTTHNHHPNQALQINKIQIKNSVSKLYSGLWQSRFQLLIFLIYLPQQFDLNISGASSCISTHSDSISWVTTASFLSYFSRQQLSRIESSIPQYSKSP